MDPRVRGADLCLLAFEPEAVGGPPHPRGGLCGDQLHLEGVRWTPASAGLLNGISATNLALFWAGYHTSYYCGSLLYQSRTLLPCCCNLSMKWLYSVFLELSVRFVT